MKKRLVSICLSIAMVTAALVGCGNSNTDNTQSSTSGQSDSLAQSTASTSDAQDITLEWETTINVFK